MKLHKMTPDEIELLKIVKGFASYKKLARFFNRPGRTIRDHVHQLKCGQAKYIYPKKPKKPKMKPIYKELNQKGKAVIVSSLNLNIADTMRSINNGWTIGHYKGTRCLQNSKTIFVPNTMPLI